MSPLPDQPHNAPASTNTAQQPAVSSTASTTSEFRPYKPPLRERELTQTAIWVVAFLIAAIGFAAVTVWLFLPSMLPKLPLTFL